MKSVTRHRHGRLSACLSLFSLIWLSVGSATSAEIPVETFASLPTFSNAKLSPSGNAVAYGIESKGRKTIVYQNLDGSDRGFFPPPEDGEIENFHWANDDILLFTLTSYARRAEYTRTTLNQRIVSLDLKKKKTTWLGRPKRANNTFANGDEQKEYASQLEQIVDFLPDEPNYILIALDFDLDAHDEVFRVNVKSGKRKMVKSERHSIYSWHTDQNSDIRLGRGVKSDMWFTIFKKGDDTWVNLDKTDWADYFTFQGFTEDPNVIYATGYSEHHTRGLYKIQVETGDIVEEVFAHPEYDVNSVVMHPVTGYPAGVSYIDDHYRIKYFDKDLDLIKRSLDKVLPDTNNYIAGRAKTRRAYLIYSDSDTVPGAYYLFDRDKGQLGLITTTRPDYDIAQSASTERVTIPVRDGNAIPAYLTVPQGTQTPSNMPAVVLPHGGPKSRDTADWDYWAQFLANRGYIVLKPNFRGSTGFGIPFSRAGENQWGGLMQDDVTDATKWLIEQGYANPERICIVGSSYGGYASLMGVIKEPGLFKCAISVNGVTDLPSMKARDSYYVGGEDGLETWGLEGTKDKEVSPYDRAEEITVPVLLMAAKDDRRVPMEQSEKLHKKLERLGRDTLYVEMENGDHYMVTAVSRMTLLTESERFLAKHIGQ